MSLPPIRKPIEITTGLRAEPIATDSLNYADNPQPRCPVVLLLDCSQSMEGEPINQLNNALRRFCDELIEDPVAALSVELSIVTFGQQVELQRRFSTIKSSRPLPELSAAGRTPMGAALRLALSEIRERRHFYREHGLPAYQPWVVLMTDGQPNDEWRDAAAEARALAAEGRLFLIGVGIGSHVDMPTLRAIVGEDPGPFRMEGLRFRQFFRWLSDSLRTITQGPAELHKAIPAPADHDWLI